VASTVQNGRELLENNVHSGQTATSLNEIT
jgi:hypothetical protein